MYQSIYQRSSAQTHIYLLFNLAYILRKFKFALTQEKFLPTGLRVESDSGALFLVDGGLGTLAAEKDG